VFKNDQSSFKKCEKIHQKSEEKDKLSLEFIGEKELVRKDD